MEVCTLLSSASTSTVEEVRKGILYTKLAGWFNFFRKEFAVMWLRNQCEDKCLCLFVCGDVMVNIEGWRRRVGEGRRGGALDHQEAALEDGLQLAGRGGILFCLTEDARVRKATLEHGVKVEVGSGWRGLRRC